MMRDYLRKIRYNIIFGLNENKFNTELIYIKECHSIIWKIIKLYDEWRFWGFALGFVFNLISVVSGLYWTTVSYLLPSVFDGLDLFGGLMWSITDAIEIVQMCDACNRIVTSVSVERIE